MSIRIEPKFGTDARAFVLINEGRAVTHAAVMQVLVALNDVKLTGGRSYSYAETASPPVISYLCEVLGELQTIDEAEMFFTPEEAFEHVAEIAKKASEARHAAFANDVRPDDPGAVPHYPVFGIDLAEGPEPVRHPYPFPDAAVAMNQLEADRLGLNQGAGA